MTSSIPSDDFVPSTLYTSERRLGEIARPAIVDNGHVVLLLPRGEAIRNFVYSTVADELAARMPVALLSVRPNPEIFSWMSDRYPNTYELKPVVEHWLLPYVRELLNTANGRRFALIQV